MADLTYTVTVASGNLYGGGTGNVFYLDGARNSTGPGTVSFVQGGTIRFEQSDSSNDNHPLIFSTDTNTSNIISSGVTYYLDGSSNQAGYTNTTTFNAATTRYVEITPSSNTDFFYLCYVHGSGMGGIFDVTSTTWGALDWSEGLWGQQGFVNAAVTGTALTSAIGNESFDADANVTVSGIALTSSAGNALGFSLHEQAVTGQSASLSVSSVVAGTGDIVGLSSAGQLASSIGSVTAEGIIEIGWGGDAWNINAWGSLQPFLLLTGQSLTTAIGSESVTANADVSVTGSSLTILQGEDISGTSHTEAVTTAGLLTFSMGTDTIGIGVPITGIASTMSAGQTTVDPTFLIGEGWGRDTYGNLGWGVNYSAINTAGLALTSSIGNETVTTDVTFSVSGLALSMTFGVYSVTADADLSITVSEHTMTSAIGTQSLVQTTNETATGQALAMSTGSVIAGTRQDVPVTGTALSLSLGNQSLVQTTTEAVSGQSLTTSIGTITQLPQVLVGVSGIAMTMSLGEEGTQSNANAFPTGISLTSSVGSPNITPWQEVDLGVNNTWTTVDLAA